MTKLEAVNEVLAQCGSLPVAALNTNGPSAEGMAERCIDEEERKAQLQGWAYNTRTDVELTPDGLDKIAVPQGTLSIDTDGADSHRNIVQIGGYLYDADDNTDEFESSIRVTQILRFEFGCIPQHVQDYIVSEAAVRYARMRGMNNLLPYLIDRVVRAKCEARRVDGNIADVNLLNTPDAIRLTGDRFTYNLRLS